MFLTMSRSAWTTVSGVLAQNCSDRSPWQSAGSSASLGNCSMRRSWRGLCGLSQGRSSNSEAPSATVTVRSSGAMTGPRMPELAGGSLGSRSGGWPPWVRKTMRSVSRLKSASRSAGSRTTASKAATMPLAGRGVTMPA